MGLSPLNQLIGIINPTSKAKRGRVVEISNNGIRVATDTNIITAPHIAGYSIGQYVLVNPDGTIRHEPRRTTDIKIYVV